MSISWRRGFTLITAAQKKQYEQEGYIIFENLFGAEEIDGLRTIVDEIDEETERKLKQIGQQGISIPNQINFTAHIHRKHPQIKQFIAQDKFVQITTELLGPDVKLYWDQSVYKRPEADRDFPWHQDNGYAPIDPQHYLTCWLALEDATIENGCIWIQPGSHHQGLVEHKKTDIGLQCYFGEDPGMPVPLTKGSMVAFHSLLFHRSTPNLSDSTRKGYIVQYSPECAKHGVTGQYYDNGPVIALGGKAV
jgi:phytanoyl-CoA hydroxylase